MGKFALKLKATLENVQELKPTHPEFLWYLKFSCSSCSEGTDKWNYLSYTDVIRTSCGVAPHFQSKCKVCKLVNTVTIIKDSIRTYTAEDEGRFKTIAEFDCRGSNPIDFSPGEGWIIKAVNGGTEFENIDLSERTWSEYCEIIKQPVSVDDVEYSFEKFK